MLRRTGARCAGSASAAFMDVAIGHQAPRRITFELFVKQAPLATENFLKLCTGENVLPRVPSMKGLGEAGFADQFLPQLSYRGTTFHRVCPGFLVQGGDLVTGSGVGQVSVYGDSFDAPAEVAQSVFDQRGLLGTAVSAPHLNGSQFFILTADAAAHLNGTCICFGRVRDGWDVVRAIEAVPCAADGLPLERIAVVECGAVA